MTVNHFGSIKHLIARFVCSFLPSKGNAETNKFLTLLNPGELRLFEAQNKFDKTAQFPKREEITCSTGQSCPRHYYRLRLA